ncbi:NfeD family protein [Leptolyngbya ohadii]|uniref:NfeD family protein n=1 Tax=Leptolyngbya ohadii TaxID=1962290 RepID=UPI000B5A0999|nr:NfeD family protein [Leptolyngbya ohadii]
MTQLGTEEGTEENDPRVGVIYRSESHGNPWRVQIGDQHWAAKPDGDFELHSGDLVRIVGRQNITLLVRPFLNDR